MLHVGVGGMKTGAERRLPFGMLTYLLASLINLEAHGGRHAPAFDGIDGIIELID
jgi:hypothetical protein